MASPNDLIVIVGDYNLPNLSWSFDKDLNVFLPLNASTEQELALVEPMLSAGFHQINDLLNVNGKLLDLTFVTDPDRVNLVEYPSALLKVDAHHKPLVLTIDTCSPTEDATPRFELDFTRCDYRIVNERIASLDWNRLLDQASVDNSVSILYDNLHEIIRETVPLKARRSPRPRNQPWWTPQLRNLRNRLRKARKRYFRNKNSTRRRELHQAEEEYKNLQHSNFRKYIDTLQSTFKHDPSSFWGFIRSRKNSARIPDNVTYRSRTSSSPSSSANLFADFFQSVYESNSPQASRQYVESLPSYNLRLPLFAFDEDLVHKALSLVDASKGPGPDLIPPAFIKSCAAVLARPVSLIFNLSLRDGIFPEAWKLASITPVHKTGNMHNVENYRPISILNCLAKVLESLIHDALYPIVQPVISEFQHGFVKKRSTTSNLMSYTNMLINRIEKRQQVDAVYVDFSKAFDKVPHNLAVLKMDRLGLPSWIINWLTSYLSSRKAFVKVHGAKSCEFAIPSGVPQGSHLGPLIFVLFVNDLCDSLHSEKVLYADDLKIFRTIQSLVDCCALQEDIERLSVWCQENGMHTNAGKCKVITFTRARTPTLHNYALMLSPLERVNSIKDLGVILDSKLRFHEHISVTISKANAMLGFLRRNTVHFDDAYTLKSLYCSLVRSVLEYAVQVWAPYHAVHIQRIERVQKRFVRYALRGLPWNNPANLPPYEQRCALIGMQTLERRRVMLQRLYIFDVLSGNIDCNNILQSLCLHAPARQLRHQQFLWIPSHRTTYGQHNPLDACCRSFNQVSEVFDFNISKLVYKNRIKLL